jgi:putative ABC transport system permease protein
VKLKPDADRAQAATDLEAIAAEYPEVKFEDRAQFQKTQADQINQVAVLINLLLAFSLIIAILGIAITLALAVFERTRELGLLRAVGMTRPQMRSMVRWESVVIALLGTLLGIVLGSFFGWATVTSASDEGLAVLRIPVLQLAIVALIAAFAGVWAARRPAQRAAKLDVLEAIATT